ncbi:MAG: FAD-binding protein [Bacillota bacterium]|nr:FAD-binding protein [Bacillota bacterium]
MPKLIVHQDKIKNIENLIKTCPFGAMDINGGKLEINSACKMCKLCVKKGDPGAVEYIEEKGVSVDKSKWNDICVYVDHVNGDIHPVTYELIGKAKELAGKIHQKVCCLFMGEDIAGKAEDLLYYGIDKVYLYESHRLKHFSIEPYTAVFEDFIKREKPCAILVGATTVGRQLAPRVAARFKTGLTADCTILDITEDTDLVQIRPAFGGNIMAQICTPRNRPQMATVRYKVMNPPKKNSSKSGTIVSCHIEDSKLESGIDVMNVYEKEKVKTIENAEVLVVAGRGVKSKDDLGMIQKLADLLGGEIACTRPLVECGWMDAKKQIGLSGRTVRPKLIITCGVSGSVQFASGMNNSEHIFAINNNPEAPIFKVASYGIVGDIYEVVPQLIEKIQKGREA